MKLLDPIFLLADRKVLSLAAHSGKSIDSRSEWKIQTQPVGVEPVYATFDGETLRIPEQYDPYVLWHAEREYTVGPDRYLAVVTARLLESEGHNQVRWWQLKLYDDRGEIGVWRGGESEAGRG